MRCDIMLEQSELFSSYIMFSIILGTIISLELCALLSSMLLCHLVSKLHHLNLCRTVPVLLGHQFPDCRSIHIGTRYDLALKTFTNKPRQTVFWLKMFFLPYLTTNRCYCLTSLQSCRLGLHKMHGTPTERS